MKILLTTMPKPIPRLLDRFLSIDDKSFRFVVDQGIFSVNSESHIYTLHFLAQNIAIPSTVLEWPTLDELAEELRREHYDFVGLTVKVIDVQRASAVVDYIRSVSPRSRVVLGGYGTLGLESLREFGIDLADKPDHVCRGEGVAFLNNLFGVQQRLPRVCHTPIERRRIRWLPVESRIGFILGQLGCFEQCEFCATSAFLPGGQVLEVMTPKEVYESVRWYYDTHPNFYQINLMDENYLAYRDRVRAIGRLLREDEAHGLAHYNMKVFGTAKAVSEWEPEELLLNAVGGIWIGVESFFSYGQKKGRDIRGLVETLHEHGISTVLSWIIGDDCQTKENIDSDIEQFIALRPPSSQLAVLAAMPGTKLFERVKQQGRLRLPLQPEQFHLLGDNMEALHFTHPERVEIVLNTFRRLYETNGPSIMRDLDLQLNGYRTCRQSRSPELNGRKFQHCRKQVLHAAPIIKSAIRHAPTDRVRSLMQDLEAKYVEYVGPLTRSQQILSDRYLRLADAAAEKLAREGRPAVQEPPLFRVEYPGIGGDIPSTSVPAATASGSTLSCVQAPGAAAVAGARTPLSPSAPMG